jgi:RHS repeat-associated protein
MTVAGENAVFYNYDSGNRLTSVVQGSFTSSLGYDDLGRRTSLTLPNGIKVFYRYDTASRLTNITYLGAVTNRINNTYDSTGNRASQASGFSVYNLPSQITNSIYNTANQQLAFGAYSMLYDADGNVTNMINGTTTNKLVWSARNQLTNMTGAVTANFLYDGLGRRITRNVSSTTENYAYDGLDVIIQKDSSGSVAARYFRALTVDEPWQRIDVGAANTNRIYLADGLGSVVALADTNKAIQTQYSYDPFGGTTSSGGGNKNTYKFTGREDDGTGLYYYRARYYHPALGRFVSEDPLRYFTVGG